MNTYPTSQLRKILSRSQDPVQIYPQETYKQVTVRLFHKGVVLRGLQQGGAISSRQWRVRSGQVLLSRIDARNGAIGLVPPELDGAIVTNDFWPFDVNTGLAEPRYLDLYFGTRQFVEDCQRASEGTTNRVRVQPDRFLRIEVPLPSLADQRRIVARIEALSDKIEEAQSSRQRAREETSATVHSTAERLLSNASRPITPLRNWLDTSRDAIQTGPFGAQLGSSDFIATGIPVLTIGNVQFDGLHIDKLKFVSNNKAADLQRYRIRSGDVLFARMGTVGRCCVVPDQAADWLINYHIIRVALDKRSADPRYIHWTIRASSDVERYLNDKTRGATRQGVNSTIVGNLPCRIPNIEEQRRIVAYLDDLQAKVDSVIKLQEESEAELNALMPSILSRAFAGEL